MNAARRLTHRRAGTSVLLARPGGAVACASQVSHADAGRRCRMVTLDRLVCLFTLTLASAACRGGHEASRTATLTITITGPGSVVLGAPVSRCRATCTIEVEQGSTVTLAPEPREGAALMSFSAPCGTEDCSVRVDADVSVSATFEWAP